MRVTSDIKTTITPGWKVVHTKGGNVKNTKAFGRSVPKRDETDRRRTKQIAYNEAHGIQPETIRKAVADVMEGARTQLVGKGKGRRVAEPRPAYETLSPEECLKKIARLEQDMFRHARELEFEEAARIRDQIAEIRRVGLGLPDALAG